MKDPSPSKKKNKFPEPLREWDPNAVKEVAPPPSPIVPPPLEPESTGEGGYSFFHGALTFIAIATVAVAGLTFIQHGNLAWVIGGLAAGGTLYGVSEWVLPSEYAASDAEKLKNPQKSNQGHHEEG
jgi:hypothetical protein